MPHSLVHPAPGKVSLGLAGHSRWGTKSKTPVFYPVNQNLSDFILIVTRHHQYLVPGIPTVAVMGGTGLAP